MSRARVVRGDELERRSVDGSIRRGVQGGGLAIALVDSPAVLFISSIMDMPATSSAGSSMEPIDDVEAYLDEKLAFFREEGVRPRLSH